MTRKLWYIQNIPSTFSKMIHYNKPQKNKFFEVEDFFSASTYTQNDLLGCSVFLAYQEKTPKCTHKFFLDFHLCRWVSFLLQKASFFKKYITFIFQENVKRSLKSVPASAFSTNAPKATYASTC